MLLLRTQVPLERSSEPTGYIWRLQECGDRRAVSCHDELFFFEDQPEADSTGIDGAAVMEMSAGRQAEEDEATSGQLSTTTIAVQEEAREFPRSIGERAPRTPDADAVTVPAAASGIGESVS